MPKVHGITDVRIIRKGEHVPEGYITVPFDLNKEAHGHTIYLVYYKQFLERDSAEFIRDVRVIDTGNNALSNGDVPEEFEAATNGSGVHHDLNEKAGGHYLYLVYTRNASIPTTKSPDGNSGPVTDLTVVHVLGGTTSPSDNPDAPITLPSQSVPNPYHLVVESTTGEPSIGDAMDLNAHGAGGWYIYMGIRYDGDTVPWFEHGFTSEQLNDTAFTNWYEVSRAQVNECDLLVLYERIKIRPKSLAAGVEYEYGSEVTWGIEETKSTSIEKAVQISTGGSAGSFSASVNTSLSVRTEHTFVRSESRAEKEVFKVHPTEPTTYGFCYLQQRLHAYNMDPKTGDGFQIIHDKDRGLDFSYNGAGQTGVAQLHNDQWVIGSP